MARTNTVISGSWALLAIFPDSFTANDLDLYTTGSPNIEKNELLSFLSSHGYCVVTSMDSDYFMSTPFANNNSTAIQCIYKLARLTTEQHPTINVIVSKTASELQPIFEFHSTIVMNFIAWYGLVCLYPSLTLCGRGLINHCPIPDRIIPCLQKYFNRGFDLRIDVDTWEDTSPHFCGLFASCPTRIGTLLGESIFFLPFDYGNILSDFVDNLSWELRIRCIPN